MKVSPVASASNSVQANSANSVSAPTQDIRRHPMRTNASIPQFEVEAPGIISDPSEQTNVVPEATQPLSPQLAAIAKQRRALQVKEREIADREKALTTQTRPEGNWIDMARLKSDPLSVLMESGVTYDQLTESILANQGNPEINELKAQIKALEEGVNKKLTDREAQAEQQVLADMRREALQLAREGDTFEMVRETGSIPDVMKLIERTYRESGEVLDVQEAMQLVEDHLMAESMRLANINKVRNGIAPQPTTQKPQPQQPQMRTLTNRDNAKVQLTSKQRALAAFHGQLKK